MKLPIDSLTGALYAPKSWKNISDYFQGNLKIPYWPGPGRGAGLSIGKAGAEIRFQPLQGWERSIDSLCFNFVSFEYAAGPGPSEKYILKSQKLKKNFFKNLFSKIFFSKKKYLPEYSFFSGKRSTVSLNQLKVEDFFSSGFGLYAFGAREVEDLTSKPRLLLLLKTDVVPCLLERLCILCEL